MSMYDDIQMDDLPKNIRDIADVIGLESTLKLVKLCSGQAIYIPKIETCEQAAKHREIYEEYKKSRSGRIYAELAMKYNYTENYVRDIIRIITRETALKRGQVFQQLELFS